MMPDDIEQLLGRLTPRGVRAELRPRVLAAVASELETGPDFSWSRISARAVAATLLAGLLMNFCASEVASRRLAQLYGPPPPSKQAMEVALAVEEVTDGQTARWVYEHFAAVCPPGDRFAAYVAYSDVLKRLIDNSSLTFKGSEDATPQKDSEVGRDHTGRAGGGRTDCQRRGCLDYRYTA